MERLSTYIKEGIFDNDIQDDDVLVSALLNCQDGATFHILQDQLRDRLDVIAKLQQTTGRSGLEIRIVHYTDTFQSIRFFNMLDPKQTSVGHLEFDKDGLNIHYDKVFNYNPRTNHILTYKCTKKVAVDLFWKFMNSIQEHTK